MVYYPIPPPIVGLGAVAGLPFLPAPMGGAWPKNALPSLYMRPMTAAKLAVAVLKDIDPVGGLPLLNPGGLLNIFSSMYPPGPVSTLGILTAHPQFGTIPGNWIRIFSELVGAATSLAIAEQEENYPYCLSMQFCKEGAEPPHIGGTSAWPLVYTAAIQSDWHVTKIPPAAGVSAVAEMPDYVIAKQLAGGFFQFATLESKARNIPVDTGTYSSYAKFKQQANNAVIAAKPGAPPPPVLSRKILSLIAVRPHLKRPDSRVLRCRWTNHRLGEGLEETSVSDRDGLRFVVSSTAVQLHNAGFRQFADALASCLLAAGSRNNQDEDGERASNFVLHVSAAELGMREYSRGWLGINAGLPRVGDIVLSGYAFRMLTKLAAGIAVRDATREREHARLLWRITRRQRLRPEGVLLSGNTRYTVVMSATGLGILSDSKS